MASRQSYLSWSGYAFETLCQKHLPQLKKALGISAVHTESSAWRHFAGGKGESGVQIDLLIDRQDHCINLCEMKFYKGEFVIDKRYAADLEKKINTFVTQTKTRKTIFPTLVTPYGVAKNDYYIRLIQAEVQAKDLFT